jgi:hypothetical protein
MDAAALNAAAWVGLSPLAKYVAGQSVYGDGGRMLPHIGLHAMLTAALVSMFIYNGIYSAKRYSVQNAVFSGLLSSALFLSAAHFLTPYGISVGTVAAAILAVAATVLWREALPLVVKGLRGRIFAPENALIVGYDDDIARYISGVCGKRSAPRIAGIVRIGNGNDGGDAKAQIEGYPVLGGMDGLSQTLSECKADVLLIAAARPWYSEIIDILVKYRGSGVDIRWEAME